jgi:hypothetical protein
MAPAWPQWRFCSIFKSKLQIIYQPVSQSARGSYPNRKVICKSLLVFNLKACDKHRRLVYVDPGHHIGVFQVDVHESGQSGSLGDDDPGSVVFRIWCLVYSQRKAPPVMITNNLNQEFTVPLWSGDVGIPGLCIRKNSC